MNADEAPGRPMKRPRSESLVLPERDKEFYKESGDCILRVEDTLFKIHRFMLIRDSPVFSSLFTLPQSGPAAEGLSDESPVSLFGDNASQFRSLFKYLYAPAFATQANSIPVTDVQDIIAVAVISHKYEMQTWQNWALLVLSGHLDAHAGSCSSLDFQAMYELAHETTAETLLRRIIARWLNRVKKGLPIGDALEAAEARDDRTFLTALYTIQLNRIPSPVPTIFHAADLGMHGIAPVHVQRILAAFCSLSLSWAQFRRGIPALPQGVSCSDEHHRSTCIRLLTGEWEKTMSDADKIPLTDPQARLRNVCQLFFSYTHAGWGGELRHACRNPDTDYIAALLAGLPETLESHFFVLDPAPA
ncbi:hypothetical protein C8R46DRAFT_1108224 [Mycena filopes]|nr:hypothetical protein C8R46DRAFT_1108224 [Mycena filopes]